MSTMRNSMTSPGSASGDRDRAGADVHAEPFPGAAAEDRRIERARAAPVDRLAVLGPAEHLSAPVALDHAFAVVGGVLCERFDLDAVPGTNLEHRPQRTTEVAPMHVCRTDREPMMRRLIPPVVKIGQAFGERFADDAALLMLRVGQRAKRPSSLRCPPAFRERVGVLVAKGAGGRPKSLFEQPVEIGGVAEAAAIGDIGDGGVNVTGRDQGGAGALKAPVS